MKLDVESAVVLANTDFLPIKTSFASRTFEQFKIANAEMVASIIRVPFLAILTIAREIPASPMDEHTGHSKRIPEYG